MEKLYLVSTGSYSDYSPLAVFTNKGLAQEYIDSYGEYGEFNDIEDIKLNPLSKVVKKDLYAFSLTTDENFNITDIYADECYEDEIGNFVYKEVSKGLSDWSKKKVLEMYVLAKDKDHAIKIAKDKASEIKATVGWGNLIK